MITRIFSLGLVCWLSVHSGAHAQTDDPFETYNRAIFSFNETVDSALIKPLAETYKAITPEIVDNSITNFFGNLGDVITVANDLLQFKFEQAANDTTRVVLNSTFGILGLFDVASAWGIPKNQEDFGQTLGIWGLDEGYYIVLPLLGPSSTRDVWRWPVDYLFSPVTYVDPATDRWIMRGVDLLDTRADLFRAERAFSDAALDPYTFQREAYLQRRRNLVYDGNPPPLRMDFDEDEAADQETDEAADQETVEPAQ